MADDVKALEDLANLCREDGSDFEDALAWDDDSTREDAAGVMVTMASGRAYVKLLPRGIDPHQIEQLAKAFILKSIMSTTVPMICPNTGVVH